jgi:hypothetical protein
MCTIFGFGRFVGESTLVQPRAVGYPGKLRLDIPGNPLTRAGERQDLRHPLDCDVMRFISYHWPIVEN